jgi:hypothetical protein
MKLLLFAFRNLDSKSLQLLEVCALELDSYLWGADTKPYTYMDVGRLWDILSIVWAANTDNPRLYTAVYISREWNSELLRGMKCHVVVTRALSLMLWDGLHACSEPAVSPARQHDRERQSAVKFDNLNQQARRRQFLFQSHVELM